MLKQKKVATNWKRVFFPLALALMIFFLSGCMAFDVRLNIEKDGSGTLVYDVLWETRYGTNMQNSIPEGTKMIESTTMDGKEYTGYQVTRSFSSFGELKEIMTEQPENIAMDPSQGTLAEAQAFRIGMLVDSINIWNDDDKQITNFDMTFKALDLSAFMGMTGSEVNPAEVNNEDLLKIKMTIAMPGEIISAESDSIQFTKSGNELTFTVSPDKEKQKAISLTANNSNNTYIYSENEAPQESYSYSGNAEENQAADKMTQEKLDKQNGVQPKKKIEIDESKLLLSIILIVFVALGIRIGIQVKKSDDAYKNSKAYKAQSKQNQRNHKRKRRK